LKNINITNISTILYIKKYYNLVKFTIYKNIIMDSAAIVKIIADSIDSPNMTRELFRILFARITEYKSYLDADNEDKFVRRVYESGADFNKIEVIDFSGSTITSECVVLNGANFYYNWSRKSQSSLSILYNKYLTYDNLVKYLLNDQSKIKYDYNSVMTSITALKDPKMKKLANYCFDFDQKKMTQLTQSRLEQFEANYAVELAANIMHTQITINIPPESQVVVSEIAQSVVIPEVVTPEVVIPPVNTVSTANMVSTDNEYLEITPSQLFYTKYAELPKDEFIKYFNMIKDIESAVVFDTIEDYIKFIEYAYSCGLNFKNIREKDGNDWLVEQIRKVKITDTILDYYMDNCVKSNISPNIIFNNTLTYPQLVKFLSGEQLYSDYYIKDLPDITDIKNRKLIQYSSERSRYDEYGHRNTLLQLTPAKLAEFELKFAGESAAEQKAAEEAAQKTAAAELAAEKAKSTEAIAHIKAKLAVGSPDEKMAIIGELFRK